MASDWHPILAAAEDEPAHWRMLDSLGVEYARIELRRVQGGVLRYKVTMRGEVIGWANSLRVACEGAHRAFLRSHGPNMGSAAPVDPRAALQSQLPSRGPAWSQRYSS